MLKTGRSNRGSSRGGRREAGRDSSTGMTAVLALSTMEAASGVCETAVSPGPTKTSCRAYCTTGEFGRNARRDRSRERLSRAQAGDGKGEGNAGECNHLDLLLMM